MRTLLSFGSHFCFSRSQNHAFLANKSIRLTFSAKLNRIVIRVYLFQKMPHVIIQAASTFSKKPLPFLQTSYGIILFEKEAKKGSNRLVNGTILKLP